VDAERGKRGADRRPLSALTRSGTATWPEMDLSARARTAFNDVMHTTSQVLQFGTATPEAAAAHFRTHLSFTTDAADVAEDLQNGSREILVIDARSAEWYAKSHIPGAISFPHRTMNEESVQALPRDRVLVVYCDGIGCNASTKGALKLAALGFRVKELLGGLDWWIRDGHSVATGEAEEVASAVAIRCGC
jgi:rhodanese-related sulfurtransferase